MTPFIARLLMMAGALLASFSAIAQKDGPVETAVRYLEALLKVRCDEAWSFYSAGTQENMRAKFHRLQRERDAPLLSETPQQMGCLFRGTLKRDTVRVVRQSSDEAVVRAVYSWGSRFNPYQPYRESYKEVRLVREGGAWRVDLPRAELGRGKLWQLTEIGPVDVFYQPSGGLRHDILEATAVARAPRESLESVLRDPRSWVGLLPQVTSVEMLEDTGGPRRARITFAGWDRPVTIVVKFPGGQVEPSASFDMVQWDAEGGLKAPVKFMGWWRLKPSHNGTRISVRLIIDPKQWPDDLAKQVHSADHIAEAVLGLEKAALKK